MNGLHTDVNLNKNDVMEDIGYAINSLIGDGKTITDDGKVTDFKKIVASKALNYYLSTIASMNRVDVYSDLPVTKPFVEEVKIKDNTGKFNIDKRKSAKKQFFEFEILADNMEQPFWDNEDWSYVLYHYFAFLQNDIKKAVEAIEEEDAEKRSELICKIKKEKTRERKKKFLKMISIKSGEYYMSGNGGCERTKLLTYLVLTDIRVLKCFMFDLEEKDRSKITSTQGNQWLVTNDNKLLQNFDFLAIHRTWNFPLLSTLAILFSKNSVLIKLALSNTQNCESKGIYDDFFDIRDLKIIWNRVLYGCYQEKQPLYEGMFLLQTFNFIKCIDDKDTICKLKRREVTNFLCNVSSSSMDEGGSQKRKREEESSLSMDEGESQKRKRAEEGSSSMNEGEQSSRS